MKKSEQAGVAGSLVGMYYHIPDGDNLNEQGKIVRQITDEIFLVQTFDFVMGDPSFMHLSTLYDMLTWKIFEYADDWLAAADPYIKKVVESMVAVSEE